METRELNGYSEYAGYENVLVMDTMGLNVEKGDVITCLNIEGYDPYILVNADIKDVAEAINDMDEVTKEWIEEWFEIDLKGVMDGDYFPTWDVEMYTLNVLEVEDGVAILDEKYNTDSSIWCFTLDQTKYYEKLMTYVKKVEE